MEENAWIKILESTCWICRRSEEELNGLPVRVELLEPSDWPTFSGVRICDVCNSLVGEIAADLDEELEERISNLENWLSSFKKVGK